MVASALGGEGTARVMGAAQLTILQEPHWLGSTGILAWAAQWAGLAVPLCLPTHSSPYILTQLIREARHLHRATQTALLFFLVFGVWQSPLVAVLLAMTMYASPYDPAIMKQMPGNPFS